MGSLVVEASRTMPHPIHQGHTHTSRVQLQVDLDDCVDGEDLVQAAESMLQQADAILESQTKVLTFNIKESEHCEYLVGEYVTFLKRIAETGSPGDQEDTAVFNDLQEQLTAKGYSPKMAMKVGGDWGIPRTEQGGLRDADAKLKAGNLATSASEATKPSEPTSEASPAESQLQPSETVAEPATTDATAGESNAGDVDLGSNKSVLELHDGEKAILPSDGGQETAATPSS